MKSRLLGYFTTYRWELWLIIGIPAVSVVVSVWSYPLSGFLLHDRVSSLSVVNSSLVITNAGHLVPGIVGLLLLSVSYLRVRRLEREFLASLWGYSIAIAVIGVVATIAVIVVAVADPDASRAVGGFRASGIRLLAGIPQYLALLWFARQLSRVSLTHAFFLVAFTSLYLFIPIQGSFIDGTSDGLVRALYLSMLVGRIVSLTVALIKVWLLGNFDKRGERFRREAIIILVATVIISDYVRVMLGSLLGYLDVPGEAILGFTGGVTMVIGLVFNLVTLLVLFGSVYLVRVRRPKMLDATPVPASN